MHETGLHCVNLHKSCVLISLFDPGIDVTSDIYRQVVVYAVESRVRRVVESVVHIYDDYGWLFGGIHCQWYMF